MSNVTAQKIAVVGLGKIALDQHLPAIANNGYWQLAATVSGSTKVADVENFATLESLLEQRQDIPVVSLCVPPEPRFDMAVAALNAGRHVMLEKPPGASVRETQILAELAIKKGLTLYTTWHSREAQQVDFAKDWLKNKTISGFNIVWREDVRRWHPGQEWIWKPAGLGVFDPGINALSILTKILPEPVRVKNAALAYPENRNAPIAAEITLQSVNGAEGMVNFDWRETGSEIWEITVHCQAEKLELKEGGGALFINGEKQESQSPESDLLTGEYPRLYQRMYQLQSQRFSDVDVNPQQLVADAFMLGKRYVVEPFEF